MFRDVAEPAVISVGPKEPLGVLPIENTFDFADRNGIAAFLEVNELVEPIIKARGVDGAAILRQKMDFILVDAATTQGVEIDGWTTGRCIGWRNGWGRRCPRSFSS